MLDTNVTYIFEDDSCLNLGDRHEVEINADSEEEAVKHCSEKLWDEFTAEHHRDLDVPFTDNRPIALEQEWCGFLTQQSFTGSNRFDVMVSGERRVLSIEPPEHLSDAA